MPSKPLKLLFGQPSLTVVQGPRPWHQRALGQVQGKAVWVGLMGLALQGAVWTGVHAWGKLPEWAMAVEAADAAHPWGAPAPVLPNAEVFAGEDAWRVGQWAVAGRHFLAQAQRDGDLEYAGWALRAAARAHDEALAAAAGAVWNQQVDALPPAPQSAPPVHWTALSSLTVQQRQRAHQAPIAPAVWQAYATMRTEDPGYFIYLGLKGFTDRQVLQQLSQADPSLSALRAYEPEYHGWLHRARHPTEQLAQFLKIQAWVVDRRKAGFAITMPGVPDAPARHEALDDRLQAWAQAGFTPNQAVELWWEQTLWGDEAHTLVSIEQPRNAEEIAFDALRQHARTALAGVHTPQALAQYYRGFADWVQAQDPAIAGPLMAALLERDDDAADRITPMLVDTGERVKWRERLLEGRSGLDEWRVHVAPGQVNQMTWANARSVIHLFEASPMPLPEAPFPAGLTPAQARAHLQQALQTTGLRRVEWPIAWADTPDNVWAIGQLLLEANAHLQAQTHWQGAVLGLKGRVSLRITTAMPSQFSGIMEPMAQGQSWVVLKTGATDWGPLLHEWFHALDHAKAQSEGDATDHGLYTQTISDSMAQPLVVLWHHARERLRWPEALDDYATAWMHMRTLGQAQAQAERAQMDQWYQSQSWQNASLRALLSQDLAAVRAGTYSEASAVERWKAVVPASVVQEMQGFRQAMAQTFHAEQSPLPVDGAPLAGSPWMRMSAQSKNQGTDAGGGYWASPTELLARAWAQQATAPLLRDADHQATEQFEPNPVERARHRVIFQTLFVRQQPWFDALPDRGLRLEVPAPRLPSVPLATLRPVVRPLKVR